ncbi:hypothetical protein AHAS_Ahas20G0224500 [Arachis hypogaea]
MYFWCPATNNFHLVYGIMGSTLMEISALTGLFPNGEDVYWTTTCPDDVFDINFDSTSVTGFIQNNMSFENDPISDSEHVAFLLLWLNAFVCCPKSIQIQKSNYFPLAIMLYHKKYINFPSLILGQLYEILSLVVSKIQWENRRQTCLVHFGLLTYG